MEQANCNDEAPVVIQSIEPAQTYALRHAVLWPEKPLAYVQLPDDESGQHFGAFEDATVVAVISLFVSANGIARFRKFATAPAWRGKGRGSALLRHVMAVALAQGARVLWCDSRQEAIPFYRRFGFVPEGSVFYKGSIAYQRLSCSLLG